MKKIETIGIIGAGQLGKMICSAAHKLGFKTVVFSDSKNSPANFVTNKVIVGDFRDKKKLNSFLEIADVITLEFENIPLESIKFLSKRKNTYPNSHILEITKNRLREKNFLNQIGVKTTPYKKISNLDDLIKYLEIFDYKAILKTTTDGYDGKGQISISKTSDLTKMLESYSNNELILEKFCEFDQEISVVIARNSRSEISCYNPLTNIHKNSILDKSIYPALIANEILDNAKNIAIKIANKLNLIGILTIEFFVLKNKELFVNEMAPRPHNSGHFSLDACYTSQFEQLVRVITNLPLGNNEFYAKGSMKNIIGSEMDNISEYLKSNNAMTYIYGKDAVKSRRKMGHVNFIENNPKHEVENNISFVKMSALGNDFIIIDARKYNIKSSNIVSLCNRKIIGCDQLILLKKSEKADILMETYNKDGSQVEICGNASRCVSSLIMKELNKNEIYIETLAGILFTYRAINNLIAVNIGKAKFEYKEIPMNKKLDTSSFIISDALKEYYFTAVNVGNPHVVCFLDYDISNEDFYHISPIIENNKLFPQKTNVEFARIIDDENINVRVWERGVGETLACGSGACAVAISAIKNNLINKKRINIHFLKGRITIEVDNNKIIMIGGYDFIFSGKFNMDYLK